MFTRGLLFYCAGTIQNKTQYVGLEHNGHIIENLDPDIMMLDRLV
jgi:hypothetical protein